MVILAPSQLRVEDMGYTMDHPCIKRFGATLSV